MKGLLFLSGVKFVVTTLKMVDFIELLIILHVTNDYYVSRSRVLAILGRAFFQALRGHLRSLINQESRYRFY